MSVATQSRITNRDLFALTLRYAMESDLAIERYAKYKGERTPSLFGDDDKPTWITVGAVDHHGGHPVQIEKKTGKMITGHFAGMTLSEAFGPVGKKHVEDRKKPGIESNDKLPLFDKKQGLVPVESKSLKQGASLPENHVFAQVRDFENKVLGIEAMPHDGTVENAKQVAVKLRGMLGRKYDYSNGATLTGMTDSEGNPSHAISPNGNNAYEVGTDQAKALMGDFDAFQRLSKPKPVAGKLLDKKPEASIPEATVSKPPRVSQWADTNKADEWESSDEFQHVIDTTPRLKAMAKQVDAEVAATVEKGDYPDGDQVPSGPLEKQLRQAVADEMVKRGMEVPDEAYKVFKMNKPSPKLMDKKPESSPPEKPDNSPKAIPFRDRNKFASDMLKAGKSKEEIESAMVARGVAISDARMHSAKALGDQSQSVGEFVVGEKKPDSAQQKIDAAMSASKQGAETRAGNEAWSNSTLGKKTLNEEDKYLKYKERGQGKEAAESLQEFYDDNNVPMDRRLKEFRAQDKKDSPGIVMPSQTIPNDQAKAGDQLGLFGDATKAKAPAFKPKLLDQPKQANLFDTKGNPNQMDLFGDGVMPDDMVYKPEAKKEQSQAEAKEGFEPYEHKGFPGKWLSPFNKGKQGLGDTIHDSRREAIEQGDLHSKRHDREQESEASRQTAESDEQAKKKAFKASGMTPLQSAAKQRMDKHLDEMVRHNGKDVTTRRAIIEKELAAGKTPKKGYGSNPYSMEGEDTSRRLTKMEYDHATILDAFRGVASVEAPKSDNTPNAKNVPVSELRESMSSVRSAMSDHKASVGDKEKSRSLATIHEAADKLAAIHSKGSNQFDSKRREELLDEAKENHGWKGNRESGERKDWQRSAGEFIEDKKPEIGKARQSDGNGAKFVPRMVGNAYDEHREKVANAIERGENVPESVAAEHGLSLTNPTNKAEWNSDKGTAISVDKGFSFWKDGYPQSHSKASDSSKVDLAANHLKKAGQDVVSVKFEHHGDRKLANRYMERIKKLGEAAGYDVGPEQMRVQGGYDFKDHSVVSLTKRGEQSNTSTKPPVEETPNPKPKAVVESPTASHSEKAFAAADIAESKGETPRQVAKAAQDQLDKDYEFARASDVRNAGEDLKGSARHRVNAWKGLQEAEKDGTAEKLVNREGLHRLEPHDLMKHADKNPLTSLAMHYALRNFPPAPAGDTKTHTAEKNREQYLDAYRAIKEKANELAASTPDHAVGAAVSMLKDFVSNKIRGFRGQNRANSYLDSMGIAASDASDKYNPTANLLVKTHNALSASTYKNKNGVMGRLEEFSKEASEKYGYALTSGNLKTTDDKREFIDNLSRHAKDVIEGQSLNKTFGKESEKRDVKRFDPSEAYVKIATRNGGRDLSKLTADPVKAVDHMVKEMGMRGVQWGNSVTDDERKHHAGKALEAITDLADVTGLHPKDIALDGKLGLAIGARGKGTASAHYEPGNKVINLTRANGVGTLAHEWGHAFDHMLNGFGLETTHKGDKVVKKGGYMSNDTDTHEIRPEKQFNDNNPWVGKTSKPELHAGMIVTKRPLSEIREAYRGLNEVSKGFRDRLKKALQEDVNRGKLSAKNANDYWNSDHEIFARSFEQHVMHKMKERGIENTYLSGMSKGHKYWPTPEESKAMAPAFDKIFEQYRKEKHGSIDPIKYSARDVVSVFMPILLERYNTPLKPFIDDGDLLYDPVREQYTAALSCLVERYDWVSSKHPRDAIGRFTKTRELAAHPDLQRHHSLHIANQNTETKIRLSDTAKGFRNLIANASRKSEFNGGDQSEESIWANVDKTALRALLEKTNQIDHESMKAGGPKFHELVNANQVIPKMIAERLHGGSRFFDPTKLRGRWNEPAPKTEQSPAQQEPSQQEPAAPAQDSAGETAEAPQAETQPQAEEAPQDAGQQETAQPAPQTEPEPQAKPAKRKRAPITQEDLPKGVSKTMSNRLEKSIKALIGDNPEAVKEFKGVVFDAWKHLTKEVSDHNQAFRQITGGLAPIELMQLIDSARKQTLDYSKKRNFDIMADTAQREYPDIIGADAEEGLSRLLETGIRANPKVTDPEVAERAVTLAGPDFFRQFDQGEAPEYDEPQTAEDWNDQFSWAVARVMVERYRREAFPERYWEEGDHPRGQPDNRGEFAKKGSPEHAKAFKDWFGDSKVVDEKGEPLKVYHGTNAEFDEFRGGSYFTPDKEYASDYSDGGRIIEAYLKINNPLTTSEASFGMNDDRWGEVKAKGHDGIVYTYKDGSVKAYIAFNPNQIKSATGNLGTFNPNSNNINYSITGHAERYAGKDQMTFNWDEAAHPREPKGADGSKGGEFTKKQSPAVKPKGIATLKDGYVLQPRAKAGGEHSDVDGKFYKGGALMPVHGLFSGMEKPPAKEKRSEGTAPIAKEDQDKQPRQIRQRSSHEVEAERERMEEQRKWDILQAGPISDLFGWIGDRPNSKAFKGSPGHKFWAPFAERLGTDGVEKLAAFMKNKALSAEPRPGYANNVEWQINNDQHSHTKKHIKAVPNSRLGEIWLDEFIRFSSLDDKLELNDKLKELLGGKEKYSLNPTQAQREAGNYKMQHIRYSMFEPMLIA